MTSGMLKAAQAVRVSDRCKYFNQNANIDADCMFSGLDGAFIPQVVGDVHIQAVGEGPSVGLSKTIRLKENTRYIEY